MKLLPFLAPLLACLVVSAPDSPAEKPAAEKKIDPSLVPVADVPGLPRVLLIGDSISMGYTVPVRKLLEGKANVHRIPANGAATSHSLANFDRWIGAAQWDVIHFNWGLHDVKIMPSGAPQVSLADYEKNLRELVTRLKPLAKKLIWCSTTPIPGEGLNPPRRVEDVIAYNAAAARVMNEHGIAIDDLYAFVLPQADRIRRPKNVHFTPEGSDVLAQQVAKVIEASLPSAKPQSAP